MDEVEKKSESFSTIGFPKGINILTEESDVPIYFIILDVPDEEICPIRNEKETYLRYFAKWLEKIRQLLVGA